MADKKFLLKPTDIRQMVIGRGACFATDRITIDGAKVGYMYREAPDNETDSGWRFMAGDETQEYMDEPANMAIYDLNTIANYNPQIIPFLESPIGSAFERDKTKNLFSKVEE